MRILKARVARAVKTHAKIALDLIDLVPYFPDFSPFPERTAVIVRPHDFEARYRTPSFSEENNIIAEAALWTREIQIYSISRWWGRSLSSSRREVFRLVKFMQNHARLPRWWWVEAAMVVVSTAICGWTRGNRVIT